MYVLSTSNKRVSVQLLGRNKIEEKLKNFEELVAASVSYLGISSIGSPREIKSLVPSKFFRFNFGFVRCILCHLLINVHLFISDLKELDLTGNLLSKWRVCFTTKTLSVASHSSLDVP